MKQISRCLLVALLCGVLIAAFAACERQEDPCQTGHLYAGEWSYDANSHWRGAICEHQNEITDKGAHSLDGSNRCTVCGYVLTPTRGLHYEYNEDKTAYIVTGYDKLREPTVLVEQTYEGLPVIGIGENAFSNCTDLKAVVLPQSITWIGAGAFYNCAELTEIKIPESVTAIGEVSFCGCAKLADLSLPAHLTEMGNGAFYGCAALKTVTIPKSISKIPSSAFYGCSGLTGVIIPTGVTEIADRAFYNCQALASLTIPEGMVSIGDFAFGNCTRISTVTIPSSVEKIGFSAFRYCTNLSGVSFLDTEGWNVARAAMLEGDGTAGAAMDVSDTTLNVKNLTDEYTEYCWRRADRPADEAPQE